MAGDDPVAHQLSGLIATASIPAAIQEEASAVDALVAPAAAGGDGSGALLEGDHVDSDTDARSVIVNASSTSSSSLEHMAMNSNKATQRQTADDHEDAVNTSTGQYEHKQSLLGATMLLATFSTTSSNVMYPSCYGTLGALAGPVAGFLLQGVMCFLAYHTLGVAVALKCKTLGELGQKLAGRRGFYLLEGTQMLNNGLFMPVALVLSSDALRGIMEAFLCDSDGKDKYPSSAGVLASCSWWQCNIHAMVLVAALSLPMLFFSRKLGHFGLIAFVSIILIVIQCALIIAFALRNPDAPEIKVDQNLVGSSGTRWYDYISSVSIFLYSFCPIFIAVEVGATMMKPSMIQGALLCSFLINLLIYVPTGSIVSAVWGAAVSNPVTDSLGYGYTSGFSNGILLFCTLLDFIIAATVLNNALLRRCYPGQYEAAGYLPFTWANALRWILIITPSLIFSLLLTLVVPKLESLVGLLTSLCVPCVMLSGPALLMIHSHTKARRLLRPPEDVSERTGLIPSKAAAEIVSTEQVGVGRIYELGTQDMEDSVHATNAKASNLVLLQNRHMIPFLVVGIFLGLALLVVIFGETAYSVVARADYSGSFWCKQIGG